MRNFLMVMVLAELLCFQNCGQPQGDHSLLNSAEKSMPFAYSATLDTLAYMSCSNMASGSNSRAFFTFRAGAYDTGGLKLSPEFVNETQFYSTSDRGNALSESHENAGTRLNLSLRNATEIQSPYAGPNISDSLDAFLPVLSNPIVAGPLAAANGTQLLHYFPGSGEERLMEASLRFGESETDMITIRNSLAAHGMLLVAGFSDNSDPADYSLRGPASPANAVYGTAYHLAFEIPSGFNTGQPRAFATTSGVVNENDLFSGGGHGWSCPVELQFKIVRSEDAPGKCGKAADLSDPLMAKLRRVLRVEDWWIDLAHKCVISKLPQENKVEADACYGPLNGKSVNYTGPNCEDATHVCPHFISLCTRL